LDSSRPETLVDQQDSVASSSTTHEHTSPQTIIGVSASLPASTKKPSHRYATTDSQQQPSSPSPSSFSSLLSQLESELDQLARQFEQVDREKNNTVHHLLQSLAEKHYLLEQDYGVVNQRLLESIQAHGSQVDEMETSLKTARDEIATLKDTDSQHGSTNYKDQWEQAMALVDQQKQKMAELEASNSDFQVETTRLIDMVNDLEETLAKTQADNYTKDCELKALSGKAADGNNNNHGDGDGEAATADAVARDAILANLKQMTQERNTLAEKVKSLQVQLQADQDRLDTLGQAQIDLGVLKTQLEAKDGELRDLQATLATKETNAAAAYSETLSQLQLDHAAALKDATGKLEQQLVDLQQQLESKTQDHSVLVITKGELESAIDGLKQQLDKTKGAMDVKDDGINTLEASLKQLEQQHDTTNHQLQEATRHVEENEKTLHLLRDQIQHLETDRDQLKQQLHESQEAMISKDDALEQSTSRLVLLEEQYTSIQQTLGEKESLYADLLRSKTEVERQLQENDTSNQQLITDRIDRINQRIDQVTASYDGIEKKAIAFETNLKEHELNWRTKQSDWDGKSAHHNQISRDLDDKRMQLDTLQQSLTDSKSQAKSHLDKLADMEARALEHQLYIGKLETEQHGFEEKAGFLEEQLTLVQDELEQQRTLAERLKETRVDLLDEKQRLETRLESSHGNLEAQQTLVDTLNTQLQSRSDKIELLEGKIKYLASSLEGNEWQQKYDALEQQLQEQTTAHQALEAEKNQQELALDDLKASMVKLQEHTKYLEHQLALERTTSTTDSKNVQSTEALDDTEGGQQNGQHGSLEAQLATLQQQLTEQTQLHDEKAAALVVANDKYGTIDRMLEQTRYHWMMEQTKVANMTEEISQLRWQLQQQVKDQQQLQRRLDETKQLLANRDQNTEALQWQVTDMESSVRYQLDQLNGQLKEAQEQVVEKSKQVDQLQQQLAAATATSHLDRQPPSNPLSPTIDTITNGDKEAHSSLSPSDPSPPSLIDSTLTAEAPPPPTTDVSTPPSSVPEREAALEAELKELRQRLERQFDAFSTIRGELTTVRDRQLNVELNAQKEKESLLQERKGLELTIERLRTEYQEHLERMWSQHQAMREHHEEDLSLGREALDSAQVKLMQNGLSPVSENGFEWVNSDSEDDDEEGGKKGTEDDDNDDDEVSKPLLPTDKSPLVGQLPPLQKPAFFEFMETPRCSGCQTDVIDI
jgi:chromosome segregation ATPase